MNISDNADAIRIQYRMLTASGIWPKKNSSLLYKLRCAISWSFAISLFITMVMAVVADINDFAKVSETSYVMVTMAASIAKIGTLAYHSNTFIDMIDFLKDPVFTSYSIEFDHYMAKTVKYSTLIAKSYIVLTGVCVVVVGSYPMLDNKPLPFPFPFELGSYRYHMYIYQIVSVGLSAWNNSCTDTLITGLIGLSSAQLDILREKIIHIKTSVFDTADEIEEMEMDDAVGKTLKQCVEHHNAIIRLVQDIEKVFSGALLAQFAASVMVICNTLFHIVLVSTINARFLMLFNYFVVMIFQLFMYCWYGNEIILKSTQIGDACYRCNWYERGNSVRTYLFIMMERSKRPLIITTMKLSDCSLLAFKNILQWSYSCLALLLKMYQKLEE